MRNVSVVYSFTASRGVDGKRAPCLAVCFDGLAVPHDCGTKLYGVDLALISGLDNTTSGDTQDSASFVGGAV